MTKNTSKMTLYEVTNKVAEINKKKAPEVEELPEQPQKPEKINKKLKMPLVIPQKGRPNRKMKVKIPIPSRLLKKHYKKIAVVAAICLIWMLIASLKKDKPVVADSDVSSQVSSESIVSKPSDLPVPDVPIRVLQDQADKVRAVKPVSTQAIDPVLDVMASPPSIPTGDHVIVMAHYHTREQLIPVKQFFLDNGIETVIEKSGRQYVLMTKEKYMNPNKRDNDGHAAILKLKEVGKLYKPPTGCLPFKFDDIYGKKIN